MPSWPQIGSVQVLGNDLQSWLFAALSFLFTFTVVPLLRHWLAARRRHWAALDRPQLKTALELTTLLVQRTGGIFLWVVALWLGSRQLDLPPKLERAETVVIVLLFWIQVAIWAMAAVRFAIDLRRRRSAGLDLLLSSSMDVILFAAGLLIWAMALLLALDNLGIQIKPLLAGLGIGGIAVALAVQTVLGDLLASMSIALDKPFGIGDFLTVGECQGTVEHIGVKSTRLRSISGEQIVMSNADILKARVRNYGRMQERRAVFQFGVDYRTPAATLAQIPPAVREIIERTPNTRFDRCHFLTYGDSALQFETVFFCTRADFGTYADAQQSINLAVLERFREMGVNFAAPTRTLVYIENAAPGAPIS